MSKKNSSKKEPHKKKAGKGKKESKGKRMRKKDMIKAVLTVFETTPNGIFNYKQISATIGANTHPMKAMVVEILQELATEGIIAESIERIRYDRDRNLQPPQQRQELLHARRWRSFHFHRRKKLRTRYGWRQG